MQVIKNGILVNFTRKAKKRFTIFSRRSSTESNIKRGERKLLNKIEYIRTDTNVSLCVSISEEKNGWIWTQHGARPSVSVTVTCPDIWQLIVFREKLGIARELNPFGIVTRYFKLCSYQQLPWSTSTENYSSLHRSSGMQKCNLIIMQWQHQECMDWKWKRN